MQQYLVMNWHNKNNGIAEKVVFFTSILDRPQSINFNMCWTWPIDHEQEYKSLSGERFP